MVRYSEQYYCEPYYSDISREWDVSLSLVSQGQDIPAVWHITMVCGTSVQAVRQGQEAQEAPIVRARSIAPSPLEQNQHLQDMLLSQGFGVVLQPMVQDQDTKPLNIPCFKGVDTEDLQQAQHATQPFLGIEMGLNIHSCVQENIFTPRWKLAYVEDHYCSDYYANIDDYHVLLKPIRIRSGETSSLSQGQTMSEMLAINQGKTIYIKFEATHFAAIRCYPHILQVEMEPFFEIVSTIKVESLNG